MQKLNKEQSLLQEYRSLCENIPAETDLITKLIKKEINKNQIRKMRGEKPENFKIFRLTNVQHELARQSFKSFFHKLENFIEFYEKNIGVGAKSTPLYDVFYYSQLALETYTRSMFTCFRCGEITKVSNLEVAERVAYHRCKDEELGSGNRTSWLSIYATFVRNDYLKEALILLDKIKKNFKKG